MDYNLIISDHRFLHTSPGFSAQALLERIESPRIQDMPELGAWIDSAADDAGVSRDLMCIIPQKEQSGLTAPWIRPFGLRAFCGYGVTRPGEEPREEWMGPEKQLRAAAQRLRQLFESATSAEINNWIARVGERFGPVGVTPANAATAALYSYTPSKPDKANVLRIWRELDLGDPLAEEQEPIMPDLTPATVADIARAAATQHVGGHDYYTHQGIVFNLSLGGYCLRFVRQCYAAAQRHRNPSAPEFDYDAFPWLTRYAADACRSLSRGGSGTLGPWGLTNDPEPGDIVLLSPGWTKPGHIGIFLGGGEFAENTSSRSRGPGTVVSSLDEVSSRIQGYAAVLPRTREPDLKIVGPDNEVIDCSPVWEEEQIGCLARPLIEALGFECHYRVQDDGRQRIYVKRQESGSNSQASE